MFWMTIVASLAAPPGVAPGSDTTNKWYDGTVAHHMVADAPFVFRARIESYGVPNVFWYDAKGAAPVPGLDSRFVLAQESHYKNELFLRAFSPESGYAVAVVEVLEVYRGNVTPGDRVDVHLALDLELGPWSVGGEGVFFLEPFVDPMLGAYPVREGAVMGLMPEYLAPDRSIIVEASDRTACPGRGEFIANRTFLVSLRSSEASLKELALRKGLPVTIPDLPTLSFKAEDGRPALPNTLTYERSILEVTSGNLMITDRDGDVLAASVEPNNVGVIGCEDLPPYADLIAILRGGQW